LARSLLADASPSAPIRSSKSENLRRNTSASAFDSARLAVNVLSDSCWIDNCLRRSSFCASSDSTVIFCSAFSILDSDKELFPSPASPPAGNIPTKMIIDPQPTALSSNRKSKIENRKFKLLGHLRRVRTVLLKDSGSRKLAELMPDHVLGDENGIKYLSVVHQKRVADKIRRHHRASRPGLDRLFRARGVHLVDLLQKMRFD